MKVFQKKSYSSSEYLSSLYHDPKRSDGFGGVERWKIRHLSQNHQRMVDWTGCLHVTQTISRHFKGNRVIIGGIDHLCQMDLAGMQKYNDGYRSLLVCTDVFSKYFWVVPLKTNS